MISHELSTIQQNAAAQDWLQSCPGYVPPNMEGLDSPFRVAYLPVRTEPKRRKRAEKPRETPERRLERYKANQLPESVVSTLREMAQTMTVPEVAAATGYSESGIKRIEARYGFKCVRRFDRCKPNAEDLEQIKRLARNFCMTEVSRTTGLNRYTLLKIAADHGIEFRSGADIPRNHARKHMH